MPLELPGVVFFDEVEGFRDAHARMIQIPAGVSAKQQLLQTFAYALELPDYFRFNWDALEECLRDRVNAAERLIVIHKDLPLAGEPEQRTIYVQLLCDLAAECSPSRFSSVFPEGARAEVFALAERSQ
jgi:hypothetical protein